MTGQYLIEYRHNGVAMIFEVYLFVNPLGHVCYSAEQELLKVVDRVATQIDVHILPFHNQNLVERFMGQLGLAKSDLKQRNTIFQAIYHSSLAYKAASLQGKKLGRHYLMRMQESVQGNILKFNNDFAINLAKEVGLDVEIFQHDMQSDFIKQLFFKDQQIALEMHVKQAPALVIFEYLTGEGRLIDSIPLTHENILEEFDHIVNREIAPHQQNVSQGSHLRLVKS